MKNLRKALAISILLTPCNLQTASAQSKLESEAKCEKACTPILKALLFQEGSGKWGLFEFVQVGEKYNQAYLGATYSPTTHLQFGLGGGLEQDSNPLRLGGFIWAGNEISTLLVVVETGGSGFWYRAEADRKMGRIRLGLMSRRFLGTGPKVEVPIGTGSALWGGPLYDHGKWNVLVGVRIKM